MELHNQQILINLLLLKLYYHLKIPACFLILTHTYYAQSQNYAGIIASSLTTMPSAIKLENSKQCQTLSQFIRKETVVFPVIIALYH